MNYSSTYPYSQSEFRGALGLGLGVTVSLSLGRLGGFSLGLAARHSYIVFQIQNVYYFCLQLRLVGAITGPRVCSLFSEWESSTLLPAMAGEDWTVVPPTPLAPVLEAEDARGQTSGTGVPHNATNRPVPRNATWNNNTPLTIAEKTSLIQEYQRERDGDPRGLTASGLGAFLTVSYTHLTLPTKRIV